MPTARNGSIGLHYKSSGKGPAVLLIAGLATPASAWWRTVAVLERSFRVLVFDHRGVGDSDVAAGFYSVGQLAKDAVAVLDAARVTRAHVYGISLGGMIAQELALTYPDRVRALVLGATTAGGHDAPRVDQATIDFFRRASQMTPEEAIWAAVPYSYAAFSRPEDVRRIGEDLVRRLATPIDRWVYARQVAAGIGHDVRHRLGSIEAPTLVTHGERDRVVPCENGRILAESIPDAELKLWPDAGHVYPTDEPKADRHVARFLRDHGDGKGLGARLREALPVGR